MPARRKIHISIDFHIPSPSWINTKNEVITIRDLWKDLVESLLYLQDEYDYTQDVREEMKLKKKTYTIGNKTTLGSILYIISIKAKKRIH